MKSLTITVFLFSMLSLGDFAYSATDETAPPAPDKPTLHGSTINSVINLKHERRIAPKAIDTRKKPRMIKQEAAPIQGDSSQSKSADTSQAKHAKHIRPKDSNAPKMISPKIAPAPKHGVAVPKEKTKSAN